MKRVVSNLFIILFFAIGILIANIFVRSASAAPVSDSPTYYINLSSNGFDPSSLVIVRNSVVVFTNTDTVAHAVSSTNAASAGPNTSSISPGQTYSFAFQSLGPFSLVDPLNKNATASVSVVAVGTPGVTAPNAPANNTKGEPAPAPTPSPASSTSANGPVAAGYETSMQAYLPAFILGGLCILTAALLLVRHRNVTSGN